jgi:hypothetical protein
MARPSVPRGAAAIGVDTDESGAGGEEGGSRGFDLVVAGKMGWDEKKAGPGREVVGGEFMMRE